MIISSCCNLSSSALYASCIPTGTEHGGFLTGLYSSFSSMWYAGPGSVPMPLNTSAHSFRMYTLVVDRLCSLLHYYIHCEGSHIHSAVSLLYSHLSSCLKILH